MVIWSKVKQRKTGPVSALPQTIPAADLSGLQARDPAFDEAAFCQRVVGTAKLVNDAWCAGDMSPARGLISDAVYVRFQTQLRLQASQGERDAMEGFTATGKIIAAASDDRWDSLDVRLDARAKDVTVDINDAPEEKARRLSHAATEPYTEVWSFIRRHGVTTKPIVQGEKRACPSCGAPIESGEVVRCGSCKKLTNSGTFDWVLAEITQAGEYLEELNRPLVDLSELQAHDPAVSQQAIEDRASMLFWKWLDARVTGSRERLERYGAQDGQPPTWAVAAFDPAVGAVRLQRAGTNGDKSVAYIEVEWSAAPAAHGDPAHHVNTLTLVRNINAKSPEGLYPLGCPVCGGPIPDTDAKGCKYCQAPIDRNADDWLLAAVEGA